MGMVTKKLGKILISIVYIIWGLYSPLSLIHAIAAFDLGAIAAAVVGVMTLLAGIFGLIGIKKMKCRIFGIVIFVFAVAAVVLALPDLSWRSIVSALLAWLYIVCV